MIVLELQVWDCCETVCTGFCGLVSRLVLQVFVVVAVLTGLLGLCRFWIWQFQACVFVTVAAWFLAVDY